MKTTPQETAPEAPSAWTRSGNLLLFALLVATFIGAWTFDRSTWPAFVGDEATYLMAAESLAWDGDLYYESRDYERFVDRWEKRPEGLILQSGNSGETITFGKPFFYSLWLTPFVRALPMRGPFVANFALISIAAAAAFLALRRRLGAATGSYVAALLFGSVAFASVFWIHIDLFLMTMTAVALALALPPPGSKPGTLRWLAAGAILAIVAFSRPFYGALYLPLLALSPAGDRKRRIVLTLVGAVTLVVASAVVHQRMAGSWTSYGGERHGFYNYTGFPGIDFPVTEWDKAVEGWGNAAWSGTFTLFISKAAASLSLWKHNLLYFLLGRHVGILPYFLPILLIFAGRRTERHRRWLVLAVAVGSIAFLLSRPFNFYGGGAAIANRYFLPLYPALWFALPRGAKARWALVAMLFAAPFLANLWLAPRAFPLDERAAPSYVTAAARRVLPYETTLDHLKPSGREDVIHNDLWIKFLTPTVGSRPNGNLFAERAERVELIIGSPTPLARLELEALNSGALPTVRGWPATSIDDGTLSIELDHPTARHPMWWTWDDFNLYHLRLEFSGDQPVVDFSLRRRSHD